MPFVSNGFAFGSKLKIGERVFPGLPLRFSSSSIAHGAAERGYRVSSSGCRRCQWTAAVRGGDRISGSGDSIQTESVSGETENLKYEKSAPMQILNLPRDFYCPEKAKLMKFIKLPFATVFFFGVRRFFSPRFRLIRKRIWCFDRCWHKFLMSQKPPHISSPEDDDELMLNFSERLSRDWSAKSQNAYVCWRWIVFGFN